MTIDELKQSWRISFHDADVLSICVDYADAKASLSIEIDTSDPDRRAGPLKRVGRLELNGLIYCVVDPPVFFGYDPENANSGNKLWIASDSSDFGLLKSYPPALDSLPTDYFRHWFFISSENGFIYTAARDAHWLWSDFG